MSAQARQHAMELCSKHCLGEAVASKLETPNIDWFSRQREVLGVGSWMHAMIRIAGADKILQHGCDETGIDGTGAHNQWAMIEDTEGIDVVIIEAGAILVDGTAEGCAQHIKTSFERGQRAVMLCLQKCIELHGEDAAEEILPIKRELLKICSTMNDVLPPAWWLKFWKDFQLKVVWRSAAKKCGREWTSASQSCW
jgi:hypothetical protein